MQSISQYTDIGVITISGQKIRHWGRYITCRAAAPRRGHGRVQVLKVTGSRVALAEQEDDGGGDEDDSEHCQNGNILDISTQAY